MLTSFVSQSITDYLILSICICYTHQHNQQTQSNITPKTYSNWKSLSPTLYMTYASPLSLLRFSFSHQFLSIYLPSSVHVKYQSHHTTLSLLDPAISQYLYFNRCHPIPIHLNETRYFCAPRSHCDRLQYLIGSSYQMTFAHKHIIFMLSKNKNKNKKQKKKTLVFSLFWSLDGGALQYHCVHCTHMYIVHVHMHDQRFSKDALIWIHPFGQKTSF